MIVYDRFARSWDERLLADRGPTGRAAAIAHGLDERLGDSMYRHPQGPVPLRPVLLPSALAEEMRTVGLRLLDIIRQVAATRANGVFELADLVGYRRPGVCMLTEDPEWNASAFEMARPDIVVSGGVVRVVECNIMSAVAGPEQVTRIDRYFREIYGPVDPCADTSRLVVPDVMGPRREVVRAVARGRGVDRPRVAVLGWDRGTGFGSAEYFGDVVDDFAQHGVDAEFAVPNDLEADRTSLRHHGRRIDVALRMFVSADAPRADLDMSAPRDAMLAGTAITLSPEVADVYSSKKLLVWVSEAAEEMPSADRDFLDRHLPWTRLLVDDKVTWRGGSYGLVDLLLGERERFVIKPSDQHGGEGMSAGADTEPDAWAEAVERGLRDGSYIVQEFMRPDPLPVPALRAADQSLEVARVASVFGPMLMGGQLGGILARHTDRADTTMVNAIGGGVMNTCWMTP
ncbi:hypothetical protein GCM10010103_75860 [Streptomyces paradoxus]|uniref:Uncharacterized protein n=1 Tax=Streptomyces paradoxus TaxID=66375 RepID=A0A7W9WLN6_9ACTN|nr:hypothetical protein [Streptomyces paradoxus]MBB6081648.1 hypothetical protein [Streptomyces paradoxus]